MSVRAHQEKINSRVQCSQVEIFHSNPTKCDVEVEENKGQVIAHKVRAPLVPVTVKYPDNRIVV